MDFDMWADTLLIPGGAESGKATGIFNDPGAAPSMDMDQGVIGRVFFFIGSVGAITGLQVLIEESDDDTNFTLVPAANIEGAGDSVTPGLVSNGTALEVSAMFNVTTSSRFYRFSVTGSPFGTLQHFAGCLGVTKQRPVAAQNSA